VEQLLANGPRRKRIAGQQVQFVPRISFLLLLVSIFFFYSPVSLEHENYFQ
jgi:hypothetical protein